MSKNENNKKMMAASKLAGLIIGILSTIVIIYSMIVMVVLKDLSPLTTLLGGIFGLASVYVGFYIAMAKAEHIEDKKNEVRRELVRLKKEAACLPEASQEKVNELENTLEQTYNKLDELANEEVSVNTNL